MFLDCAKLFKGIDTSNQPSQLNKPDPIYLSLRWHTNAANIWLQSFFKVVNLEIILCRLNYNGDLNTNYLNTKLFGVPISNGLCPMYYTDHSNNTNTYQNKMVFICMLRYSNGCDVQYSNGIGNPDRFPSNLRPFKYQTNLVFRSPLYYCVKRI